MNTETHEKLKELRLLGMLASWSETSQQPEVGALSFDDRFAMLVDAEHLSRQNKKMAKLLLDAKLKIPGASFQKLQDVSSRGIDRSLLRHISSCQWLAQGRSVLVTGPTGVGKTYLACAIASHVCRSGFRALYKRAPRFFDELTLARADGTYPKLLARLAKVELLVLDDFAIAPMSDTHRRDLLEVMDDRFGQRATVVTSQLPPAQWHDYFSDPTLADAICDRLLSQAHAIVLTGDSRRKDTLPKD